MILLDFEMTQLPIKVIVPAGTIFKGAIWKELKALVKWANKKQNNFNIYNVALFLFFF